MASDYGNLAGIYHRRGDRDAACDRYRKALALFTDIGMKPESELIREAMSVAGCPDV